MNEPAEAQDSSNSSVISGHDSVRADSDFKAFEQLKTLPGHTGFTLAGSAFLLFEILFVYMCWNSFWFTVDIRWLGIPAVLVMTGITHFLLLWQEGSAGCQFFAPIWQQKPPIVYSRWLSFNDPLFAPGLRFGNRHLVWNAIDELHLSFWGNLIVKSRSLSGPLQTTQSSASWVVRRMTQPDVVLKFPFSVASPADQRKLVETIRSLRPDVVLNQRLRKAVGLDAQTAGQLEGAAADKLRQGTVIVTSFGAIFLFAVLLDAGYSTFHYLQTLKGYYLCMVDASAGDFSRAQIDYNNAEDVRLHPIPFSWVTTKLMSQEPPGPELYQTKAKALWLMGKKDQAIEAAEKALELAPRGFRHNLLLARMFTEVGRTKEAEEQIGKAIDNHKGNFLSALYMVALKQGRPPVLAPLAKSTYAQYKGAIDDQVFGTSALQWPPSGERFLHDIWYKDDVEFVFDRLIGAEKSNK